MAIILALISSALFGASDFLGGVASRRTHVLVVVGASHVVGLFLILLVTPFMADAITLGILVSVASRALQAPWASRSSTTPLVGDQWLWSLRSQQ